MSRRDVAVVGGLVAVLAQVPVYHRSPLRVRFGFVAFRLVPLVEVEEEETNSKKST